MNLNIASGSGSVQAHCVRLPPGADLVPTLQECARQVLKGERGSVFVMSAVGSLSEVTLRMASANDDDRASGGHIRRWTECFEIVSLVGTFSLDAKHLHLSISNAQGETIGGHLVAGKIFTTLELVLGTIDGVVFERKHDEATGYRELVVSEEHPKGG
mmetsp:Transcript_22663/g.38532  ORF Transcript_22663/g.38532 Transcript_22663/m.38532 type:complete len:158 (-) Transcript_22663:1120-1593(-)